MAGDFGCLGHRGQHQTNLMGSGRSPRQEEVLCRNLKEMRSNHPGGSGGHGGRGEPLETGMEGEFILERSLLLP
jgi:hypothetical protein